MVNTYKIGSDVENEFLLKHKAAGAVIWGPPKARQFQITRYPHRSQDIFGFGDGVIVYPGKRPILVQIKKNKPGIKVVLQ